MYKKVPGVAGFVSFCSGGEHLGHKYLASLSACLFFIPTQSP